MEKLRAVSSFQVWKGARPFFRLGGRSMTPFFKFEDTTFFKVFAVCKKIIFCGKKNNFFMTKDGNFSPKIAFLVKKSNFERKSGILMIFYMKYGIFRKN